MRNKYVLIALVFLSLAISRSASASYFYSVAASCLPSSAAVQGNLYASGSGVVTHAAGVLTEIQFVCPISMAISAPAALKLQYSSTENNASTYVTASYYKMKLSTGVSTLITSVGSLSGTNNGTVKAVSGSFTDSYDLSTYTYYVVISLQRRNTSQTVNAYSVSVE